MLVAPGYQYSQIDPNLTMTRDEHEEKFRAIRAAVRKHGYRWLASPVYQDFLTGDTKLPCAPWGSVTRNPYGWKGPCYLLTDGDLPDLRGARRRDRVGALRARQRPPLRALRDPLRLRARGDDRDDLEREGDRAEPRVDAALKAAAEPLDARLRARGRGARGRRAGAAASAGRARRRAAASRGAARVVRPRGRARLRARAGHARHRPAGRRRGGHRALGGRAARASPGALTGGRLRRGRRRRRPRRAARARASGPARSPSTWRARPWPRPAGSPASSGRSPTRPSGRSAGSPTPRRPDGGTDWGVGRAGVRRRAARRRVADGARDARRALAALGSAAAALASEGGP